MTLIAERPFLLSLMLGVLAGALIYGWLQTGKKPVAIAGLVALVFIPLVWWISDSIVTDREAIIALIHETADAVEANDHERALKIIGDPTARQQAGMELPRYEFMQADVGSIREIVILDERSPPQAEVDMTVKVHVSEKRGAIKNVRVPRRLNLVFEKQGTGDTARWVIVAYQHMPVIGKPDAYTTQPVR